MKFSFEVLSQCVFSRFSFGDTLKGKAEEIGIRPTVLTALRRGEPIKLDDILAIADWLGEKTLDRFLVLKED